jgi:hypothetical protein
LTPFATARARPSLVRARIRSRGTPVAASHEAGRLLVTYCGLAARKDDAAQQRVDFEAFWTLPSSGSTPLRLDFGSPDHLGPTCE